MVVVQAFGPFLHRLDQSLWGVRQGVGPVQFHTTQRDELPGSAGVRLAQLLCNVFLIDLRTVEWFKRDALLASPRFGLFAQLLSQAFRIIRKVGVPDLLPVEKTVEAAGIVQQPGLTSKA